MATPPEVLYDEIFERMEVNTQRHEYDFLVENHLRDSELDRGVDIQYDFCLLWSTILTWLWNARKNKTRAFPFPLFLPIRTQHTRVLTNSYFTYYTHQLHYLLDSTLNLLHSRFFSNSHHLLHDQPLIVSFDSCPIHDLIQLQYTTLGSIYLTNQFIKQYIDQHRIFDPRYTYSDVPFESTVGYLKLKYTMLRIYMCWMSGCDTLINPKIRLDGTEREQDAVNVYETGCYLMTHIFQPLRREYQLQDELMWYRDMKSLEHSCAVQCILIRAERLVKNNNELEACHCWQYAHKVWQWPLSPTAEALITIHLKAKGATIKKANTKTESPTYILHSQHEPISNIQLTLFTTGRLRTDRKISFSTKKKRSN